MHISVRRFWAPRVGRATHRETPRLGHPFLVTAAVLAALVLLPSVVLAHGQAPIEPTMATLIEGWTFAVDVWLPVILAALAYWQARSMVDRRHPNNPVPRWRAWSWYAGLAAIVVALASPIEFYDTTLFSAHMIQHLLLTMVAAPLLALAAPITLLLRVSSPEARRKWILPVLNSRIVAVISYPVVAWVLFAAVMWFSHFSPLFDAALDDFALHRLEHALFLGSALLFWWPVVGADPSPHRMTHPGRILYLALGMPLMSLLGMVIFSAQTVLYDHYLTLERDWGWTPLQDQEWAGGIMWAGGDGIFVLALVLAVAAWLRHEERENKREDARLARAKAARKKAAEAATVAKAATASTEAATTTETAEAAETAMTAETAEVPEAAKAE
jgi:cytochrome c oxidase assembly factor CtaG